MSATSILAAIFSAFVCITLPVIGHADVRIQNVLPSKVLNKPVSYAVYLPPDYDDGGRDYPVLYLLHGGGTGQPSDWFTLSGIDQMLDQMILSGQIRPLIAVAPDGRRDVDNEVATYFLDDADGSLRWQTMFIEDFIPGIEDKYRAIGNGDARALLGISMGGMAASIYQLKYPDMFAGISALSASFRTEAQMLALSEAGYNSRFGTVIGSGLTGRDRLTAEWTALQPQALIAQTDLTHFTRVPRFYFDTGADDPFFEATADLHIALRDAGISHRFKTSEGEHDWPFWRGAMPDALLHIDAVLTRNYGE
jgi:enterochelin esterase-like enzyme